MTIKNIFTKAVTDELITRIERLTPQSQPLWGKMSVAQMLAHCCVSYEMVYEMDKFPKPGKIMKFIIQLMAKSQVTGEKPYAKNGRTAPAFLITDEREFDNEKNRITGYLIKTQQLGDNYFEGKESLSFGKLSTIEWNNLFYKHLDHHLGQFGV
jgi:hypothetical protein